MNFKHLNPDTPIETYCIGSVEVSVKRDDLYGSYPAPPLAKLRGASILLANLREQGITTIGVIDTKVSKAGQGIAYICSELELKCIVGFPLIKGHTPEEPKLIAQTLGATLCPLTAGRFGICYARFKKYIEEQGGYMLPVGLTCPETVKALALESSRLGSYYRTIVVCTGTGTIATGLALGSLSTTVYGVSCGMSITNQRRRINQLSYPNLLGNLILVPPSYGYYDKVNNCPFPAHPYYDTKAWDWLCKNIDKLEKPVLFWDIGS